MESQFGAKVVLIAGGTGGLGRVAALSFLRESATVVVTYRDQREFAALKDQAAEFSSSLEGHRVDATNEDEVGQMVRMILSAHSRLDILVNAIGGYAGGSPLWLTSPEVFDRMLALNLRAGFVLSRAVVPVMLKQGSGSIVNVSSKAALDHAAGAAAYAASKAASLAMTDCLAADLKGTGVRVNSILPSIIDTEANRQAMPDADFSKWPKPEQIANVILFLCGDGAALIHGAAMPVYGQS
jgi:NAD(P)-dependent dehydrogenase (short-subunit alcohol dehydrogenase family)